MKYTLDKIKQIKTLVFVYFGKFRCSRCILMDVINTNTDILDNSLTYVGSYCLAFNVKIKSLCGDRLAFSVFHVGFETRVTVPLPNSVSMVRIA